MMRYSLLQIGIACLIALSVAGCKEEEASVPERVRSIKTFTVTEAASGNLRVFPGTIVAANKSSLSFPAAGTVEMVNVKQGDQVTSGQVLATLDPQPFRLEVDAARSQLASAQATYEKLRLELEAQQTLYEKKIVVKKTRDKAAAAASTAQGEVEVARSRLAQLERDLERTELRAPFDGSIAKRSVDPFVEVSAGQEAFELNAGGDYEIEFSIPDQDVKRITHGQSLDVDIDAQESCGCSAKITEIGTVSGSANAVKILAAIADPPAELLPGTSANAKVLFSAQGTTRGFLVPIVAVAPSEDGNLAGAFIFKYSADTGTVQRVPIKAGEGHENMIEVREGVELGDVIASAGVSFLRDGQKVKPLESAN